MQYIYTLDGINMTGVIRLFDSHKLTQLTVVKKNINLAPLTTLKQAMYNLFALIYHSEVNIYVLHNVTAKEN